MATFTNQATLSYAGNVTTSNVVSGELQQTASVTKTALDATYTAGSILTYVVSIVNSGATPLTDLTVTDDLGAYSVGGGTVAVPLTYIPDSLAYFVDGVRQADPTVTDTEPLTVTGISVPAGGDGILIYQASVNGFAPPAAGGSITNTASVSGGGLTTPVTNSATVAVATEAFLTINKALSPATVSEGDRLTYTFVIQNFGNAPVVATDDATVTDTFSPILSDLTVTLDGQTLAEGTDYTYNEAGGEFATLPGRILVPAATYVRNPDTGAWTVIPGVTTLTVVGTV